MLFRSDEEESDRLFSFEVKKANEQEEDVKLREGFVVRDVFVCDNTKQYTIGDHSLGHRILSTTGHLKMSESMKAGFIVVW